MAGLRGAAHRWADERDNRRVEIALDYTELRNMAAAEGQPLVAVLRRFQEAGATSVAVQEDTVATLEDARLVMEAPADSRGVTVLYGRPPTIGRVEQALRAKTRFIMRELAPKTPLPAGLPKAFTRGLIVAEPPSLVRTIGVGLPAENVRAVHSAGLAIVGRVSSWQEAGPSGILWTIADLKRNGASTVIFVGDDVLGFDGFATPDPKRPDQVSTATALRNAGLYYGTVEFGKQKGDPELCTAVEDRLVRVHTVTGSEMQTAEIPGNIQRFLLAARERDIRLLYVRLFPDEYRDGRGPLSVNTDDYVRAITYGLQGMDSRGRTSRMHRDEELTPGVAHGYGPLGTSAKLRLLMGIGVAAGWILLVDAVVGLFTVGAGTGIWASTGLIALVVIVAAPLPVHLGAKIAALAAALVFPSLALLRKDALRPPAPGLEKHLVGVALGRFLVACLISACGIALIVGLLADRAYLLKIDVFAGIKPAKMLPVLLVAFIYAFGLRADGRHTFAHLVHRAGRRIVRLGTDPLQLWQIAAAVIAVIIIGLAVLRAGNDPGVGVSGAELSVRSLLDRLLPTRPRFQEFLIGHPALILAFLIAARRQRLRVWAIPLLVIGAIGQVSLINTFCHIHTPLVIALWRAGLGIGFGALIAVAVYLPLDRFVLRHVPMSRVDVSES
jgi:hypothetical protein